MWTWWVGKGGRVGLQWCEQPLCQVPWWCHTVQLLCWWRRESLCRVPCCCHTALLLCACKRGMPHSLRLF